MTARFLALPAEESQLHVSKDAAVGGCSRRSLGEINDSGFVIAQQGGHVVGCPRLDISKISKSAK